MGRGVTTVPNHQNRELNICIRQMYFPKKPFMAKHIEMCLLFGDFLVETLPSIHVLLHEVLFRFPNRIRTISTSRLNALLRFYLKPINVIIFHGPMISYLETGFPLRCFQRLSIPDIATRQCHWRDSRQTRGQFIPVLSY